MAVNRAVSSHPARWGCRGWRSGFGDHAARPMVQQHYAGSVGRSLGLCRLCPSGRQATEPFRFTPQIGLGICTRLPRGWESTLSSGYSVGLWRRVIAESCAAFDVP